jgi:hypothetical protein
VTVSSSPTLDTRAPAPEFHDSVIVSRTVGLAIEKVSNSYRNLRHGICIDMIAETAK